MKFTFTCLIVSVLFLSACVKDKPDLNDPKNYLHGTTDTTGGGGGTTLSSTYQPVTKGTYWKYVYVLNGVTDTVTTTMTGDSTVINGRTYYGGASVYQSGKFPASTGYLSNQGHIYVQYATAEGNDIYLYFLNDTTAVGHGWTSPINPTGSVNGVPGQFVGTIIATGLTKTINGKTFKNVIHDQVSLQYDYGTGFSTFITYDNYIAQGIGLIEVDSSGLGVAGMETIFDYSIK